MWLIHKVLILYGVIVVWLIPNVFILYGVILVRLIPKVLWFLYGVILVMLIPILILYGVIIVCVIPKVSKIYGVIVLRVLAHHEGTPDMPKLHQIWNKRAQLHQIWNVGTNYTRSEMFEQNYTRSEFSPFFLFPSSSSSPPLIRSQSKTFWGKTLTEFRPTRAKLGDPGEKRASRLIPGRPSPGSLHEFFFSLGNP